MIYSMTAYARHEVKNDEITICWDIRSVNHRYLDLSFRLPEELRDLEPYFRDITKKNINRGKLDLSLKVSMVDDKAKSFTINMVQAKQVIAACQELASNIQLPAPVSPLDILLLPSIRLENDAYWKNIKELARESLPDVLAKLNISKRQEGKELLTVILRRLKEIEIKLEEINNLLPNATQMHKAKLLHRLKELQAVYDEGRLEQELLYLTQRTDIAEELDRLSIHVKETKRSLTEGGVVGRRLDFLMQEINREVNTLAAKSTEPQISLLTVDLKVLIEQIREQAQNLE